MPRPDDKFDDDRPRRRSRDDDDDRDRPPPRRKSNVGLILGIVFGVLLVVCGGGGTLLFFGLRAAFKGATDKIENASDRMHSSNNLKQIGLGVLEYETKMKDYPINSYAPEGKPLLSWRVHILPYIEQDNLYKQFNLNEPWDSANNRRLLDQMPQVYASPAERVGRAPRGNKTYYRGFAGGGGAFSRRDGAAIVKARGAEKLPDPRGKLGLLDFAHTMTLTPIVVEAGDAVEWTKPDDLDLSAGKPFPNLGGIRENDPSFIVLFADGSVRAVPRTVPEAERRKAVDVKGAAKPNLD